MNDDTLTLYFYDDGLSEAERREVEEAIATDPDVAARYQQLQRALSGLVIEKDDPLPADMRARFHDTIERAARLERARSSHARPRLHFGSFFWGAAVTAALAIGIGIGVWFGGDRAGQSDIPVPQVVDLGPADAASRAVFERSVRNFLRQGEREIGRLSVDSAADRTTLIIRLIEQNRLFEKAATQNDAPQLARVLRAFEPVLLKLAAEDIAPEEAEALRAQLEFEFNVMLTKLERESSNRQVNPEERT